MYETAVCLVGRRPHPATDGLLCRDHLEEIGKWLREIEDETARLSAVPRMETVYDSGGSSLASQRAPAVLDAIVYRDDRSSAHGHRHIVPVCALCPECTGLPCTCPPGPIRRRAVHWDTCPRVILHPSCLDILADRDEWEAHSERLVPVLGVLHEWAQRVREERQLQPPTGDLITPLRGPAGIVGEWRHTVQMPYTVMTERNVLTRHLDWIAARPWVADMRRELGGLRTQLLRLNRNDDPHPLPGWCIRLVDDGRGGKRECGGDLWPAEPAYSTGYETRQGIRAVECSKDSKHHRWEGEDLPRLLAALDQQQRKDNAS